MTNIFENVVGWFSSKIVDIFGHDKPYPKIRTCGYNICMVFVNFSCALIWATKPYRTENFEWWSAPSMIFLMLTMALFTYVETYRVIEFYKDKKKLPEGATHLLSKQPDALHDIKWFLNNDLVDHITPGGERNPIFYNRNYFLWTWSRTEIYYRDDQGGPFLPITISASIKKTKFKNKKEAYDDMFIEQLKGSHVLVIEPGGL